MSTSKIAYLFYELRNIILACTAVNEYSTSHTVVKAYMVILVMIIYVRYEKKTSCEDTEERLFLILSKNTHYTTTLMNARICIYMLRYLLSGGICKS